MFNIVSKKLIILTKLINRKFSIESNLYNKIVIYGGGNVSESIIAAIKHSKIQDMNKIVVVDVNKDRLHYLHSKYNINTSIDPNKSIKDADLILIAVKPANITTLSESLTSETKQLMSNNNNCVLLSVVAGCTVENLNKHFLINKIVRSMPNTPASVLEGMTVWYATRQCVESDLNKVELVLKQFGKSARVSDENSIDMATAVSGSGPAYVFLMMESMIDSATHLGFPRNIATQLVIQTIKGTAIYAEQAVNNKIEITTLRHNVTSPGGTTASALYSLESGGFRKMIADTLWSAYRRALELGGKNSNVGPGRSL